MIDLVHPQIDAKMAALGKRLLIGQSKRTCIPKVYADIMLIFNTQVCLCSSPFRHPYLFYFPTLLHCFLFLSLN